MPTPHFDRWQLKGHDALPVYAATGARRTGGQWSRVAIPQPQRHDATWRFQGQARRFAGSGVDPASVLKTGGLPHLFTV